MLITLTGATGSGKSTLAQALVDRQVQIIPTWTTRPLRPEEIGRGDIVQVSHAEMAASDMLESAEYDGHLYGTPLTAVVRNALAGRGDAVKILEPKGLEKVRHQLAEHARCGEKCHVAHVFVDIRPDVARHRLLARCHNAPGEADRRRLARVEQECTTWREAAPWTLVVDNSEENRSMEDHAEAVIRAGRELERQQMAQDRQASQAGQEGVEEARLLFLLLRDDGDPAIRGVVAQGGEAMAYGNQVLVQEAVRQLAVCLREREMPPLLAEQLKTAVHEMGLPEALLAPAPAAPDQRFRRRPGAGGPSL